MSWKRYGWMGLALLGAAGCGGESITDYQPVQMKAKLESFESCESLENYIEDTAVRQMRTSMERSKPSHNQGGWFGTPRLDTDAGAPVPVMEGGGASAPKDYTGTNNQVEGVDEADFVKNDGTRLFVLSGSKLYLHRSWPAAELRVESSLALEGWPRAMFLEGDRVVVFSRVDSMQQQRVGVSAMDVVECSPYASCGYGYGPIHTKVTTVDVANLSEPRVTGELYLPGDYHDARMAGGSVRLVLRDQFRWPEGLRWWPQYSEELYEDQGKLEKEIDRLMDANEGVLRARTIADWLPESQRKRSDGTMETVGYDCRDFHRTNAPTQLGFVTVASLDLSAPTEKAPGRTTVVTEPGEVYATADSIYLSTRHWWSWLDSGQTDHTYVHKLALREPGRADYVASGTVEGHLLNQFSMDEHQGVLRVATTIATRVFDFTRPWGRIETTNRITTYVEKGGRLELKGKSEELAKGERIYSARFLGNKGYVVTFRQVDPLFTFDLSDPARPRKVGELKVPGFSSYIHPVGDTHLLTIGMHVPEDGSWQGRAVKLSLFDVSDLANPRERFTQTVGTTYGWSEALYEHKAFNYFPAKGLVAIPFVDSSPGSSDYWSSFVSDLRVFRVDTAAGFSSMGSVSLSDLYRTVNEPQWSYTWSPVVRRSVMADDYVYAISDAGVRVSHLGNLTTPLATAQFQPTP